MEGMIFKGTVVIQFQNVRPVLLMLPWGVRRGIVQGQQKGLGRVRIDIFHAVIGEEIGYIFVSELRLTVHADRSLLIAAAAVQMHRPFLKALARAQAVAHMPFADEAHVIARFPERIEDRRHTGKVIDGLGFGGILHALGQMISRNVARAQPVVNAVRRGEATGDDGAAGRRADRRGAEEIGKACALVDQLIEVGRDELGRILAQRPCALIIGQNENDIRSFIHRARLLCILLSSI